MDRSKYLFKIYYIGKSKFYGSQRQSNFLTIEDCVLKAFVKKKYIHNLKLSGFESASRTDRFVSARGACFSCVLEREPVLMEINSVLPYDIGIWAYTKVPLDFSSRFNAKLRHYVYIVPKPFSYLRKVNSLNIEIMHKACRSLEGRHDFINFSKRYKSEVGSKRDIKSAKLTIESDFLIFQFKSKAFLRQQIRRMVEKVLELGIGKIMYDDFIQLLDPLKFFSYQPADPRGLILWDIIYDEKIKLSEDLKSKERMETYFLKKKRAYDFKYQLFNLLQHNDFSE
ncbi:MAG: tRNA pseudouridine synthase A [Candidatus Thorarchaeota archaeon]